MSKNFPSSRLEAGIVGDYLTEGNPALVFGAGRHGEYYIVLNPNTNKIEIGYWSSRSDVDETVTAETMQEAILKLESEFGVVLANNEIMENFETAFYTSKYLGGNYEPFQVFTNLDGTKITATLLGVSHLAVFSEIDGDQNLYFADNEADCNRLYKEAIKRYFCPNREAF